MVERILVTGATGTVGGATLRQLAGLADPNIEITAGTRSEHGAKALRDAGFSPVVFDFDRPETLRPALEGIDSIFLVTGYSVDMIAQSKRVLDAARSARVRHIVHLGALASEDTPFPHFAWHQIIERAIAGMGFAWTNLRPNFFMDTVWAGFRLRPDRVVHFVGDQRVSWIASGDIGAVAAEALRDPARHAGRTYNLATEAVSFRELAAILTEVTGRSVEYRPRAAADLLPILLKQGMEPTYAASLSEGVVATERGEMPLSDAVFDDVEAVAGRKPVDWRAFAKARLGELASSD